MGARRAYPQYYRQPRTTTDVKVTTVESNLLVALPGITNQLIYPINDLSAISFPKCRLCFYMTQTLQWFTVDVASRLFWRPKPKRAFPKKNKYGLYYQHKVRLGMARPEVP
jgi:hypothetical protein